MPPCVSLHSDHPSPRSAPLASPSRSGLPPAPSLSTQEADASYSSPAASSSSSSASSALPWPEASAYPTCRLTIVLTSAKGLAIPASAAATAKPYAVLQFDQTESVTREPGEAEGLLKLAKGKRPGPKWRGLKTIGGVKTTLARTRPASPVSSAISSTSPPAATSNPVPAHPPSDPVWNHTATFDIIQPKSHVYVSVYDRGVQEGEEGFLGGAVVGLGVDSKGRVMEDWVSLWDKDSVHQVGQVHFRMDITDVPSPSPKPRRVTIQDFEVIKHIGEGSYGQVYRVRKRDTNRIYAMKVLSKKDIISRHGVQHVLAERQILAKTSASPFLVGLKFSFQTPDSLHFVMDLKSGGELMSYMQRYGGKFPEPWVVFYTAEILSGIAFLHSMNIVYRDLKPENCLLDSVGHVALCDFGLSKPNMNEESRATTFCGTTEYIAPEILKEEPYGRSVDFWALGVLIFEMTLGWTPFFNEDRVEKYNLILESNIEAKFPKRGISEVTRNIILGLLEREVPKRLGSQGGASQVSTHAFFDSIKWDALCARRITPPFKPRVDCDDVCGYMERPYSTYRAGQGARRSSADDLYTLQHQHPQRGGVSRKGGVTGNALSAAGFGMTNAAGRPQSADERRQPATTTTTTMARTNGNVVPSIPPCISVVDENEPFRDFTFSRDTSMDGPQRVPPPQHPISLRNSFDDDDDMDNSTFPAPHTTRCARSVKRLEPSSTLPSPAHPYTSSSSASASSSSLSLVTPTTSSTWSSQHHINTKTYPGDLAITTFDHQDHDDHDMSTRRRSSEARYYPITT